MNTWFITGASRGLGLEVARIVLARGDIVVATARDPRDVTAALGQHDQLLAMKLDVTDEQQAHKAVAQALEQFGRIDVLVNNAGRGFTGGIEETTDAETRATFDVNLFGLLNVTRAVLPAMRAQRSGRILNVSSVSGFIATQGVGIYAASKFAVEAVSESLRAELEPVGVTVTLVEPGAFRTDFLDARSMVFSEHIIDDYAATAGTARTRASHADPQQPGDPIKAAAAIVDIASADAPPMRLVLGTDAMGYMERKLASVRADLDTWKHISLSTDL